MNNKWCMSEGQGHWSGPPRKGQNRDMEEKRRDKDKRTNGAKPKPWLVVDKENLSAASRAPGHTPTLSRPEALTMNE